jgi:hypothetical protein
MFLYVLLTILIQELCRPASTWTFHNSTDSDPSLYVETDVILPLGLETLAIVSGCRECKSRIKLKASSTYRGENVRLNIRAGHREMAMLREMNVCHQLLANMNITSFIRVSGTFPTQNNATRLIQIIGTSSTIGLQRTRIS